MQNLINVLALSSFIVSAAVVGSGVYIYTNKDPLIEKAKEQVMESIKETLSGALTVGCERISILATTADGRYSLGTTAQTANASTSHFIKNGERIELDVPQHVDHSATGDPASIDNNANYGNLLASNIAVIRDASTDGVLEVTEFVN